MGDEMNDPRTDAEICAAIEDALENEYNDDRAFPTRQELEAMREDARSIREDR